MSEQQPDVVSSEPVDARVKPTRRRVVVAGIALVGVGALAGGIAASASGAGASTSRPFAASPSVPPSGAPDGPGRHGGPFGGGLLGIGGDILHGSAVVKDGDGTKTMDLQNGTVTAVSDKALTVKSSDGFPQSYTVVDATRVTKDWAGSTASAIKIGDTVMVLAEEVGGAHQAVLIADGQGGLGGFKGFKGGGGFKHFRGGPGGPGGLPYLPVPPSGAPPTPNA